ncbi:uncharacterized protein [Periplaneta americana]|uniref:uncharacterized protein isoform X1 n=1 Tax=Periplaneta americana TaxID=6978 RepID=UPI0037E7578A
MKLPIVILTVLGVTFGKSLPTRNLQDDLNDFLALVPVDEITAIVMDYLANDAEVQEAVVYLQGEEFHKIVLTVEGLQEFRNFVQFLEDHGLDAVGYINQLHSVLGWDPYVPPSQRKHARRGVGVDGLIDDIIAILPIDDLKALFLEKLETSPDFKAFYDAVRSPEFQSIVQTLNAMPEYQDLLQKLRDKGVDIDHYIELIRALFGLSRAARNLQDDLNDFLALIPTDQILAIAMDYLANDAEVQELVAYLQSDDFHKIMTTIEALPEFANFYNFLKEHGLDVVDYINEIHSIIGLPPFVPPSRRHTRRGVGINGLIDDVIAILPVDELKALFQEKLETSPDFKALYEAIRSPEFQSIISTLNAMPEYQKLLQNLRNKGVDVDHFIELIRALFGLSRAARNLQDDLNDFLALIPTDQILAIAMDYLANDAEVQELVAYLQSDAFHKIITTIEALPEFANFYNFLKEHGLDVVDYINEIHSIIGLPPFVPPSRRHARKGVGINGLIDDVIAILPVDELKALFQEKLETSPDFKALYDAIRSPEFQSIISTLNAMPEYQELLQNLRDKGVDVDHFIELIRALFGLSRAARNFPDDQNGYLALIPTDQILAIAMDYLANDAEVQELMAYLQSDDFHKIMTTIEALPEFANFYNFLKEHGLDVVYYINEIHSIIGLPPFVPPSRRHARRGVGIDGLIDDIIAILPVDALKDVFQEYLETCPDFKALYEAILSPEFQSIISTLNAMPEYQELLQNLRDKGFHMDHFIELIRSLYGLP